MKKFLSILLCCVLMISCFAGCDAKPISGSITPLTEAGNPNVPQRYSDEYYDFRQENQVSEEFLKGLDSFSYDTVTAVYSEAAKDENFCYSPLSLYMALAILANGAEGDTERELLSLLNESDKKLLSDKCKRLYNLLYKGADKSASDESSQEDVDSSISGYNALPTEEDMDVLELSNSLWISDGISANVKDSFLNVCADNFYASMFEADFTADSTADEISNWIFNKTHEMIKPSFKPEKDTLLTIINTLYFHSSWRDPFEKGQTAPRDFFLADGNTVSTDFMNRLESDSYGKKGDNYSVSSLSLASGSMTFILPDKGTNASDIINSPEKLSEALDGNYEAADITWSIPKFEYSTTMDLIPSLQALGVSDAFTPDAADFSGISDVSLFVTQIMQETKIGIDELGVEAAAYTAISMAASAMAPAEKLELDMTLDRPFIYVISDWQGVPLFVGLCSNPTL